MKIKDCGIVFTDGNWIESKDQSDNGIRLLQTGNIGNGVFLEKEARAKYISEETFENLKCTEIFEGDILISRLPEPVGRACIVPKRNRRMITAVDCTILRVDESVIDKKYLLHFLKSQKYFRTLTGKLAGTTRKRVSRKNLGEIEVDLPDRPTQEHIGNVIENLELIIQKKKEQLEEYDTLIKSRFVEMFGDLKNNKSNYAVSKIGDFADVLTGATPKRSNSEYYDGNIPWVKTGEISKGYIYDAEEHITKKALKETNCKLLPPKTIMVAMYGQGKTRGQAGMLEIEASTNQACAAIIPNEMYSSNFLLKQLDIRYDELREHGRGGNQPNLNLSMIKNFEVILPELDVQNQFANFVYHIDKLKFEVQKSLDETQLLFDSLMQEYFG